MNLIQDCLIVTACLQVAFFVWASYHAYQEYAFHRAIRREDLDRQRVIRQHLASRG